MPKEYKKMVCIINDRDCDDTNTCDDCYIAIEERQREQEELNLRYNFDLSVNLGNRRYFGNRNRTVIKAEINDLEYIKKIIDLQNPKEISRSYYLWDVARYYPEWEKTKEILKITNIPDKYLFEKDKPLIVFFGNIIYVIAPRCEE